MIRIRPAQLRPNETQTREAAMVGVARNLRLYCQTSIATACADIGYRLGAM
jgi:hypothetical protein